MGVGISLSGLASAVASRGGIGIIAANGIGMIEPDYFKDGKSANIRALRNEIRTAKAKTSGVVGVNIMVALEDFSELLNAAIEECVDMIVMGAGLPVKNIPVARMRENGVKAVPIVSSARAAGLIFKMWDRIYHDVPDAVVIEGPKAGGHLGFSVEELDSPACSLETVIPQVSAILEPYGQTYGRPIPIIAAGGIFTGEDIYRYMKLGAQGVQMGTRFVATDECDADIRFKEAYVACKKEDIGIIKSPVGLPGRAILNDFLQTAAVKKKTFNCPWQCLAGCRADEAHYCISMALNNARKGNLDRGFVFVGSNAYRVDSIVPVSELIAELEEGYMQALFADKKRFVAEAAEKISKLKIEYTATEKRLRNLGCAYEHALTSAVAEGMASVREEYRKAYSALADLQLSVTERVCELYGKFRKKTEGIPSL